MKKDYIVEQSDIPLYTRISAMPFDIRYERDLIERVCKTVKTPTNFPIDRIRSTSSSFSDFNISIHGVDKSNKLKKKIAHLVSHLASMDMRHARRCFV